MEALRIEIILHQNIKRNTAKRSGTSKTIGIVSASGRECHRHWRVAAIGVEQRNSTAAVDIDSIPLVTRCSQNRRAGHGWPGIGTAVTRSVAVVIEINID